MDSISLFLKGILMGMADIVPGVSGGTIAFITGIYPKLISVLSSLTKLTNLYIWKRLFNGNANQTLRSLQLPFLFNLGIGVAIGILLFGRVVGFLLENYQPPLWTFFFTLILMCALFIFEGLKKNIIMAACILVGTFFAFSIINITPSVTHNNEVSGYAYIFVCGFIAISAMLLPGISGSFILLLLGQYAYILNALNTLNFKVLGVFAFGCICGLLLFSKIINWLLKNFKNEVMALLCGIMLGSLLKLWPWRMLINPLISPTNYFASWTFKISSGEVGLLPQDYEKFSGQPAYILISIFAFFIAMIISVSMFCITKKNK